MRAYRAIRSVLLAAAGILGAASSACSSSNGGGSGDCSPASGTYKVHYTTASGSASTCVAPPDETITITSSGGIPGGGQSTTQIGDAGSCTSSSNGCTFHSICTTSFGSGATAVTNSMDIDESFSSAGGSGTQSSTETIGGMTTSCAYDFTWTRQ